MSLCVLYVQRPEIKLRYLPHLLFTFFFKTVLITFPWYLLSQRGFLDLSPMDPLLSTTPGLGLQADTTTSRSSNHTQIIITPYTGSPTTPDHLTTPRLFYRIRSPHHTRSSHYTQIIPLHQAVLTYQISLPHQINYFTTPD